MAFLELVKTHTPHRLVVLTMLTPTMYNLCLAHAQGRLCFNSISKHLMCLFQQSVEGCAILWLWLANDVSKEPKFVGVSG